MCSGRITGEVENEEATQEKIMEFATKFDINDKIGESSKQEVKS
jgi:methyl-galactoside transport system ATP-binding protein